MLCPLLPWPPPAPSPLSACPCSLPSVVEYYGSFHDGAHLYIIMEYCGGGDLLEKLLRDKKAMHEKRVALDVALPCLSILGTLHDMRIIHRWAAEQVATAPLASPVVLDQTTSMLQQQQQPW